MHHYFIILLLALFWAPTAVLVKFLLHVISPISIVAFSSAIAAIVFIIYQLLYPREKLNISQKQFFYCTLVGLLAHSLPFTLQCYALTHIQSIWVAIIIAAIPIFTIVLSTVFIRHEKISKPLFYGILVGFLGMMVLIAPSWVPHASPIGPNEFKGVLLSLLAAIMHSLGLIITRLKLQHQQPWAMPTIHMVTTSLYLLPIALYMHPQDIQFLCYPSIELMGLLWLSIPGTGLAYFCYYKLLNDHPAVYISLINYILPIFKTLLGLFFLHETLTFNFILAFVLILSGIVLVGEQNRKTQSALSNS